MNMLPGKGAVQQESRPKIKDHAASTKATAKQGRVRRRNAGASLITFTF
jgi:hypothetical protein